LGALPPVAVDCPPLPKRYNPFSFGLVVVSRSLFVFSPQCHSPKGLRHHFPPDPSSLISDSNAFHSPIVLAFPGSVETVPLHFSAVAIFLVVRFCANQQFLSPFSATRASPYHPSSLFSPRHTPASDSRVTFELFFCPCCWNRFFFSPLQSTLAVRYVSTLRSIRFFPKSRSFS